MNWSGIKDTLYDWANSDGDTVIWRNQNGPQPTDNYFALELISSESKGQDYKSFSLNDDNERTYTGNRDFIINLHYYGTDAFMKVDDKANSLEVLGVQSFLRSSDIVYVDKGTTTNAPNLYDSDYKEHALNVLKFRAANVIVTESEYFDHVSISGQVKEGDTVKRTIDINVSI